MAFTEIVASTLENKPKVYVCLATDVKVVAGINNGSILYEIDAAGEVRNQYLFFAGAWKPHKKLMELSGRNVGEEVTLQDAADATGNGTAIYMGNADTFKITEISGTSTSRTLVFEVCGTESGTYSAITGIRLSDLSTGTQTTSEDEIWQFDGLAGLWFRARLSAIAGGNVTVNGKAVA